MTIHLTDQQLVDRLYGIEGAGLAGHLEACPECQARWNRVIQRREVAASVEPVAAEFFQQQRREIQDRIAKPSSVFEMWVPATIALVLGLGLVMTRPGPKPVNLAPEETAAVVEANWFEDTYSAGRQLEPSATSPIRRLFAAEPVRE